MFKTKRIDLFDNELNLWFRLTNKLNKVFLAIRMKPKGCNFEKPLIQLIKFVPKNNKIYLTYINIKISSWFLCQFVPSANLKLDFS